MYLYSRRPRKVERHNWCLPWSHLLKLFCCRLLTLVYSSLQHITEEHVQPTSPYRSTSCNDLLREEQVTHSRTWSETVNSMVQAAQKHLAHTSTGGPTTDRHCFLAIFKVLQGLLRPQLSLATPYLAFQCSSLALSLEKSLLLGHFLFAFHLLIIIH